MWAHWEVLTVSEKQVCLDRCSPRVWTANSLLFTVHACLSTSSMCISTAQARKICLPAAGASSVCALVVVPCAFWYMVVTFRGRRKGNLVFWCSKVDFSWQVQGIGAVLLRSALFVAGAALWTWWWSSRSSDFVTGVVNRDFWTCGSFADFVWDEKGRWKRQLSEVAERGLCPYLEWQTCLGFC